MIRLTHTYPPGTRPSQLVVQRFDADDRLLGEASDSIPATGGPVEVLVPDALAGVVRVIHTARDVAPPGWERPRWAVLTDDTPLTALTPHVTRPPDPPDPLQQQVDGLTDLLLGGAL